MLLSKNNNKRGFLQFLTLPIVIVLAVLIILVLVGLFVFSSMNKYVIVGGGMIALSLIYGLRGDFNRTKAIFLGAVIIGGLIMVFSQGVLQDISSGDYVNVAVMGYYECSPAPSSFIKTITKDIPTTGTGYIVCKDNYAIDGTTDKCKFTIGARSGGTPIFADSLLTKFIFNYDTRVVYEICDENNNCQPQVIRTNADFVTFDVPHKSKVWVDFQSKRLWSSWKGDSGASYSLTYQPFIIWQNNLEGGRIQYTSIGNGCNFGSKGKSRVITDYTNFITRKDNNDGGSTLEPYETWNFVDVTIPISVENANFVKGGYCSDNGNVHPIEQIKTYSGTYKIVNYDETIYRGDCCPSQDEPKRFCNDNLIWENIVINEDTGVTNEGCDFFNPCDNRLPQKYASKKTIKEECINNKCVATINNVECTEPTDCNAGYFCNQLIWKCEKLQIAIDGTSPSNRTGNDTNLECAWYEQPYEKEVKDWKWYNYATFGLVKPKTATESGCKTADWVWIVAGSVIIIVLGSVALLTTKPKRRRRK